LIVICPWAALTAAEKSPLAFPEAEGFGARTPGGRGGQVIFVTNLNDSGPGSLREACQAEGARIVRFKVAGTIELKRKFSIKSPFLTIEGQSAPAGGICIKNHGVTIDTHDVIVRYLRFRPGDKGPSENDGLTVWAGQNVIVDHCSVSWAIDETLTVTKDSRNVTVQWCILSESLYHSRHSKGAHGMGSVISPGEGGITFHHNIYAHHNSRSPRAGGHEGQSPGLLDFRNNLIYDWGHRAGYCSSKTPVNVNYVSNYLKPGPSTPSDERHHAFLVAKPLRIFLADNRVEGASTELQDSHHLAWHSDDMSDAEFRQCLVDKAFPSAAVATEPADKAYRCLLAECGATLPLRDAVDTRIIRQIETGTGKIIDSQDDVGGWPDLSAASKP
jgi:pectate lyase